MGLGGLDYEEARSTPKLSLSRLPCKPKLPIQMLTPPLHPSLSIPFQWEEAPGRPRFSIPAHVEALDLPPRLLPELTIMPSPPALFHGPYASLFACCDFSFRRFTAYSCGASRRRRWKEEKGSFHLSQTLGDFFMRDKNKVHKMPRITRVRSLFHFSCTLNSNLWVTFTILLSFVAFN